MKSKRRNTRRKRNTRQKRKKGREERIQEAIDSPLSFKVCLRNRPHLQYTGAATIQEPVPPRAIQEPIHIFAVVIFLPPTPFLFSRQTWVWLSGPRPGRSLRHVNTVANSNLSRPRLVEWRCANCCRGTVNWQTGSALSAQSRTEFRTTLGRRDVS